LKDFEPLDFLPIHNLYYEYKILEQNKIIKEDLDQVCLTTTPNNPDDYLLGIGSLVKNWDEKQSVQAPINQSPLEEKDFSMLCTVFKNTIFEEVYNELTKHYKIGRLRIMRSRSKTCLSWHYDHHKRIHYVMRTGFGNMMVIENTAMHLPKNTWWLTDTTKYHTAVNASMVDRYHLVGTVL